LIVGARIVNDDQYTDRSPSGLPLRHLVTGAVGSISLYAGEQWLQPDDEVLPHTHTVEEVLLFTAGSGEVRIGNESCAVHAGVTIHIPAGEVHGFRNTGQDELRLYVLFPGNEFAATKIEEP
jgi:mannose-6-phosphate isomerase-like protein (cupin superfamily)